MAFNISKEKTIEDVMKALGEPCISMSLLYCAFSGFYFRIYLFILLLYDPVFLTTGIRAIGLTHRKARVF